MPTVAGAVDQFERYRRRLLAGDLAARADLVSRIAAVAQALTVRWTWPVWHERVTPPNLPVIDYLADAAWGPLLLGACILTVVVPRVGSRAFCLALGLSILGDQFRLQPGVVSLAVLMIAASHGPTGRSVARWSLSALWLWSGLHKALSLGWSSRGAAFIATSLGRPDALPVIAVVLPLVEILLGLSVMVPRLWRGTALTGLVLHLAMITMLSPLMANWNSSVWPWNMTLAISTFLLFWSPAPERLAPGTGARLAAVALLAYPALFYVGWADTYLAHNLYSENSATARVCVADTSSCRRVSFSSMHLINVPLPPEPRLYRQWFAEICLPETSLEIVAIQTRITDPDRRARYACPART